jgi:hypothetical protein
VDGSRAKGDVNQAEGSLGEKEEGSESGLRRPYPYEIFLSARLCSSTTVANGP